MKKITLTVLVLLVTNFVIAQAKDGQLSKKKWLIEANTGFGDNVGNTSFYFSSKDGKTSYNVGLEGGYFIKDNLALKLGLGFGKTSDSNSNDPIAYKIGVKYYFKKMIPIELSYNGVGIGDTDANPKSIGLQAGYAIFIGKNISIEPGVRYNKALYNQYFDDSFQFNIGFALHL